MHPSCWTCDQQIVYESSYIALTQWRRRILLRHDKFIQVSWHIFATTTVITLLSSIFVFSITPIYRATAYLPKQNPDDLVLVSSAVFLSSFVQDELVRFHDYEQFQRSEPIFSGQIVSILKENISFSSTVLP